MRRNFKFCKYLISEVKFIFILSLIVIALVHVSSYLLPYANKLIFDKFFFAKDYKDLFLYFGIFAAILVFSKLIIRLERMFSYYIDERVNVSFRKNSLIAIFKKDFHDYSKHNYGELETIYNNSVEMISNSIYSITESVIAIPIAIFIGLNLIVSITPFLIIFLVLEVAFMMLTSRFGAVKRSKYYEGTLEARKNYFNHLEKTYNAFENIRLNFNQNFAFKRLFEKNNLYKKKNLDYLNMNTIIMTIFDLIDIMFEIATIFFFILMIKKNSATPGDYFAYVGIKTTFVGVFNGLAQINLRYKELDVAINDINNMIKIEELIEFKEPKKDVQLNKISNLSLRNLKFSYTNESPMYDFNYDFTKGNIYVIQGENGIGKSTFIRLLTGLLKPNSGGVMVNDENNIDYFTETQLFNKIKVLTQKPVLYDDSLINNIVPDNSNISEKEMDAYFESFFDITDILKIYDNDFNSNILEDGIRLSGGQVKRIAMQNMFCSNADVLIFDEPFGELDEKTKIKFYSLIKSYYHDKIIIMISHEAGWKWDCNEMLLKLELDEKNVITFKNNEKIMIS